MTFDTWKLQTEERNSEDSALNDTYIQKHEAPRTEQHVAYSMYTADYTELANTWDKTRTSSDLRALVSLKRPTFPTEPSTIYTRYYSPQTTAHQ